MIQHLSTVWSTLAAGVANHLWQSTLFLLLVAGLTFVLRHNHAAVRHALWLAASAKFLLPFSLLVILGSFLSWSHPAQSSVHSGFYIAIKQVTQPFTDSGVTRIPSTTPEAVAKSFSLGSAIPYAPFAIWCCGFLAMALTWYLRWSRVSRSIDKSQPIIEGREIDSLRRMEVGTSLRRTIKIRSTNALLEPGIFGIVRPTLVWPQRASTHLSDAELDAITAHELAHVRRWDNLAAALHMLVQSIFWFHPLVWWMGNRILEERERACDQDVLDSGAEPRVYAEGILKICELCLRSPLPCISGVSGADLKQRIVRIMSHPSTCELNPLRKLLILAVAVSVTAIPIAYGFAHGSFRSAPFQTEEVATDSPSFEVASIRQNKDATGMFSFGWFTPGTFTTRGATVQYLVQEAYQITDDQLFGAPSWLKSERYDIRAKVPSPVVDEMLRLDFEQSNVVCFRMLQNLLADRFKLAFHKETRELPMFALVIAKNGSKLHEARADDSYPDGIKDMNGKGHGNVMGMERGQLVGQGIPISALVRMLSQQQLGLIVVDKTGLTSKYDFTLKWNPENLSTGSMADDQRNNADMPSAGSSGPSLFAAIQDQLGLKLERQKGPLEVLVIDHVERPSPN